MPVRIESSRMKANAVTGAMSLSYSLFLGIYLHTESR